MKKDTVINKLMNEFHISREEIEQFEKKYNDLEIPENNTSFENTINSIRNVDIEKSYREILLKEKQNHGIDWEAFFKGDLAQDVNVSKRLAGIGSSLNANGLRTSAQYYELPNYSISNSEDGHYIDYVKNLRGEEITKYVSKMAANLQTSENLFDVGDMISAATTMLEVGIASVGAQWVYWFTYGRIIGWGVRRAAVAAARQIGRQACKTFVGLLVVGGIYALYKLFDKDASMLCLVVNYTGNNINLEDAYAHNGKIVSLPECVLNIDTKETCSIKAGENFGTDFSGESIGGVAEAGWINATKRDAALKGVKVAVNVTFEGVTEFESNPYIGFNVPYSGKNKCGCTLKPYKSSETFLKEESDSFSIGNVETEKDTLIQAYLDSEKGGNCSMVCFIEAPIKPL